MIRKTYRMSRGESHHSARLTATEALTIFLSPDKVEALASIYSVSVTTIQDIKRGKTWVWLTADIPAIKHLRRTPMRQAFTRWLAGEHTPEVFEEMCRAHDITYVYSDDHSVWSKGRDESTIISQAATSIPHAIAVSIWNRVVRLKITDPRHIESFLWSESLQPNTNDPGSTSGKTG